MFLKNTLVLITTALLLASCGRTVTVTQIDIIPEPVFLVQKEGAYTLNRNIAVATSGLGQNSPTAKYIMNSLRHGHLRPSLVSRTEESDIELILNDTINPELGDEGYLLEVRQTGIRLSANTEVGLFYAYQTLRQMIPADVLEHSYSSITLPECTVLDHPRFAWRGAHLDASHHYFPVKFIKKFLDLMSFYKLNRFHWQLADEETPVLPLPGGYDIISDTTDSIVDESKSSAGYTEEEIAEVVAYAASLGITVVPEEGTDMVWDDENGVTRPGEILKRIVAARTTLQAGHHAARTGNRVVMCPEEFCRLDYYQADPRYQPLAEEGLITLAKAYQFDPAPQGTNKYVEQCIVGGQSLLFTESIDNPAQAEYMLLPRLLAISECLWTPRETKNWSRFRKKVEIQKARLASKGYNYCEGSFTPLFRATRVDDRTMNIAIETEVPSTYIFYTTDSTTPTRQSQIYLGPINLRRGTHIKILPVYKDQERDSVYEFVIK